MSYVNKVEDIKNERAREFHSKNLASFKNKYYAALEKTVDSDFETSSKAEAKAAKIKKEYNAKLAAYVAGVEGI
jgi:hypothetical protein